MPGARANLIVRASGVWNGTTVTQETKINVNVVK
jgi:hypothetical protein